MSWGRLALAAVAAGAVGAFLAELLRPRRRPGSSFLSAPVDGGRGDPVAGPAQRAGGDGVAGGAGSAGRLGGRPG